MVRRRLLINKPCTWSLGGEGGRLHSSFLDLPLYNIEGSYTGVKCSGATEEGGGTAPGDTI